MVSPPRPQQRRPVVPPPRQRPPPPIPVPALASSPRSDRTTSPTTSPPSRRRTAAPAPPPPVPITPPRAPPRTPPPPPPQASPPRAPPQPPQASTGSRHLTGPAKQQQQQQQRRSRAAVPPPPTPPPPPPPTPPPPPPAQPPNSSYSNPFGPNADAAPAATKRTVSPPPGTSRSSRSSPPPRKVPPPRTPPPRPPRLPSCGGGGGGDAATTTRQRVDTTTTTTTAIKASSVPDWDDDDTSSVAIYTDNESLDSGDASDHHVSGSSGKSSSKKNAGSKCFLLLVSVLAAIRVSTLTTTRELFFAVSSANQQYKTKQKHQEFLLHAASTHSKRTLPTAPAVQKQKLPSVNRELVQTYCGGNYAPLVMQSSSSTSSGGGGGKSSSNRNVTVDVISIGTLDRPTYQRAQANTFGTHKSVRFFFRADEHDDLDPICAAGIDAAKSAAIAEFCTGPSEQSKALDETVGMKDQRAALKDKPAGWLCAQRRPLVALKKAMDFYAHHADIIKLPDWLLLLEDDTYYNLQAVLQQLQRDYAKRDHFPHVVAGCRMYNADVKFGFYHAGMGLAMNTKLLEYWNDPILCNTTGIHAEQLLDQNSMKSKTGKISRTVCHRLANDNLLGEADLWQDGMRVIDLVMKYAASEASHSQAHAWTRGYCLQGNWALGYFLNHYNRPLDSTKGLGTTKQKVSKMLNSRIHSSSTADGSSKEANVIIKPYQGSEWIFREADYDNKEAVGRRKQCTHENVDTRECLAHNHMCHYVTPEQMYANAATLRQKYPQHYRGGGGGGGTTSASTTAKSSTTQGDDPRRSDSHPSNLGPCVVRNGALTLGFE